MAGEDNNQQQVPPEAQQPQSVKDNIVFGAVGMNMDASISQVRKGELTYALNATIEGYNGNQINYQNELGNEKCFQFPQGYKVCGHHNIMEKDVIVFFLCNPSTGDSEIGIGNPIDCSYTTVYNNKCLNFSLDHPIYSCVHRITNCGYEIYFVDNYNEDRYLDFSNVPSPGDCNSLSLKPNVSIPIIDIVSIDNNGELTAGTVQFAVQYCNVDGEPYTQFYSITNPIPLYDGFKITPDFNYSVNKSIKINIRNIDTSGVYDYINVVAIETVNNISTPKLIGTYKIELSNKTISYTGAVKTNVRLTLNDIFQKYPLYITSNDITTAGDILIRDQVKEYPRLNYQDIANKIKLQWISYRVPNTLTYKDETLASKYRGYLRDEVYAFDIVFLLKKGKETDRFHIPGRMSNPNDLTLANPADSEGISNPYVWKVYNTASVKDYCDGWKNAKQDNTYFGEYQYGDFSYWESSETYPNIPSIYGELAGMPIRHHKFPDNVISPFHDDNGNIYPLGIKIDINNVLDAIKQSSIPQQYKDDIIGFKIVRANRANNKSIIGRGLLYNIGKSATSVVDTTDYTYFSNYLFNDVSSKDPFINQLSFPSNLKNLFTFHSPDTSFYQPYLGSVLKIESVEYGSGIGNIVPVRNHAKYKLYSNSFFEVALGIAGIIIAFGGGIGFLGSVLGGSGLQTAIQAGIIAYNTFVTFGKAVCPKYNPCFQYNSVATYDKSVIIPNNGNKLRRINAAAYILPGVQGVGLDLPLNNWNRESAVYINTTKTLPYTHEITGKKDTAKSINPAVKSLQTFNVASYYATIKNIFDNQYGQLDSYSTVDTGYQAIFSDLATQNVSYATVFGGDTYINRFGLKRKIPLFIDNRVNAPDESDIFYNELNNIGSVKYYFSTDGVRNNSGLRKIGAVFFGTPDTHALNNRKDRFFSISGMMYLFIYGIPYFYVESQVNVDLRQAYNSQEGDYYPHASTGIPNEWLQEVVTSIVHDNTYNYNKSYSKQNDENYFSSLPLSWTPDNCQYEFPYKAIYSEPRLDLPNQGQRNNWLVFKPVSFFDFPQNFGKLIDLKGIENKSIIARFENKSLMYNMLLTINTSNPQAAYLGNNEIFKASPPIDIRDSDTDLGYVGTQNRIFLKTENGNISIDAKRGQVFLINTIPYRGTIATDITGVQSGMSKFFTNNLDFKIKKYFPDVNTDNHYKGIGIHGVYDSKFNRLILTKLDYIPLDSSIKYDGIGFYKEGDTSTPNPSPVSMTCCPDGYTYQNGQCIGTAKVPAKSNGLNEPFNVTAKKLNVYSYFGTKIYESGYNPNGTSVDGQTVDLKTSNVWLNDTGTNGPMNRCAIWNGDSFDPTNVWVTVVFKITVPKEKIYYVGCSADNGVKVKIGCNDIINTNLPGGYNPSPNGSTYAFNYWHVYPIKIPAGTSYVELSGWNNWGPAAFGFEVYDNTLQELINAKSTSDLNIVFSTASLVGKSINTQNYTCDNCQSMYEENDSVYCISTKASVPPIACPQAAPPRNYLDLNDSRYFCNKSFTISFDFDTKSWVSFHSYLPNYYVGWNNVFYSGINDDPLSTCWVHMNNPCLLTSFYNNPAPYILEFPLSYQLNNETIQSIQDYTKVLTYFPDNSYIERDDFYFNKAIIYNNQQCSGILNLYNKPIGNLQEYISFPRFKADGKDIIVTKSNGFYNFNTFWSVQKDPLVPSFIPSCDALYIDKVINQSNMDYSSRTFKKERIRGKDVKIRLISDNNNTTNVLVSQFLIPKTQISYK